MYMSVSLFEKKNSASLSFAVFVCDKALAIRTHTTNTEKLKNNSYVVWLS